MISSIKEYFMLIFHASRGTIHRKNAENRRNILRKYVVVNQNAFSFRWLGFVIYSNITQSSTE